MSRDFVFGPDVPRQSRAADQEDRRPGDFAEAQSEMLIDGPVQFGRERVELVPSIARRTGLLDEKTGRISPMLLEKAKRRTGIGSDTDLHEFALANLALDDGFADAFKEARATVDPTLTLGL